MEKKRKEKEKLRNLKYKYTKQRENAFYAKKKQIREKFVKIE